MGIGPQPTIRGAILLKTRELVPKERVLGSTSGESEEAPRLQVEEMHCEMHLPCHGLTEAWKATGRSQRPD